MNSNISCLYESIILEQQVNYFILENKYIDLRGGVITESSDSKIEKFKKFAIEKLKKIKEIIDKIITAISKVLQKIFPFLKKKQKNEITIETYDLKNSYKYVDELSKIAENIFKTMNNTISVLTVEEVDNAMDNLKEDSDKFTNLKDPLEGEKKKQKYDSKILDDFYKICNNSKQRLNESNKVYNKVMGEMSQTINVEEFDKDQKLIKYISAANSTLVKIYTSVIKVANEICSAVEVKGDISELTKLFGEPILADIYTAHDVKTWVKSRERQLNDDNNAVCMKVHENTLKKIGQYNINSIKNLSSYIALVIYNKKTNKIIDSQLIYYNELDERLNNLLANGHGMFIIDP